MREVFDALWRGLRSCLAPQVIVWSLVPLCVAGGAVLVAAWRWWEPAVMGLAELLQSWTLLGSLLRWLGPGGAGTLREVVAPLALVAFAVPMVVILTLLIVAWSLTPALVERVAAARFPTLERRGGWIAWGQGWVWSLGCALLAVGVLILSLPLWLIPPLGLLIPALVWGWLTAQVFTFDTLAAHADPQERRWISHHKRWPLLLMGVVCALLGSMPSLLWALGLLSWVFAPLIALISVWLYTWVFALASLWFAHFTLSALARLREVAAAPGPGDAVGPATLTLSSPSGPP